jgi:hypothetical protein
MPNGREAPLDGRGGSFAAKLLDIGGVQGCTQSIDATPAISHHARNSRAAIA